MIYIADVLIFFAFILVITDFFVMSYGTLTLTGSIFFVIGTVILFSLMPVVPVFFERIILPTYITLVIFVSFFIYLGYKAHKSKLKVGSSLLAGETGIVTVDIKAGKDGQVEVNGELWTAFSDQEILKGSKVVIISENKLRLKVKPYDENKKKIPGNGG